MSRMWIARWLGLVLLVACGAARPAAAQSAAAPPPASPSTSDLRDLSQTLQDPARRDAFLKQLDALIAVRTAGAEPAAAPPVTGPGDAMVASLAGTARRIGITVSSLATITALHDANAWVVDTASDPAARMLWLSGLAVLVGVLLAGAAAEYVTKALLSGVRRRLAPRPSRSAVAGLTVTLLDAFVRLLPAGAFLAACYAVLPIALAARGPDPGGVLSLLAVAVINARTIVRAFTILVKVALAHIEAMPKHDHSRDETAHYWSIWFIRLARLVVYSDFALRFWRQIGLNPIAYDTAIKALGLVFVCLVVILVLQSRHQVAHLIRGPVQEGDGRVSARVRAHFAATWHIAAVVYLVVAYGLWIAGVIGGLDFLARATALSLLIGIATRIAIYASYDFSHRILDVSPLLTSRLPGLQARASRYTSILGASLRAAIMVVSLVLLAEIWGLGAFGWLVSAPGQRFLVAVLTVVVTICVAVVAWEIVSLAIEAFLADQSRDGSPVQRSARVRTLLPLLRKTLATVLAGTVVLVLLSELGVNIAPLLAGAGVVGIAVGFGAQSLVKDVITGLFILMQDAVAVGDVVTVAGNSGMVEQVSIRSIRLRSLDGTVILIPFSEVTTVKNMTKDFSYAMFNIGVAYREDIDAVMQVIVDLATEMCAEDDWSWRVLAPIDMLGVDQFADSAVIVKARIKTRPIQQWNVMREFNRRMKNRFDELNIEIPFPHQTIYFGVDKEGNAPPARLDVQSREPDPGRERGRVTLVSG